MASKKLLNRVMQFIKFCFVGVINSLISYLTYLFLTKIGLCYILSNVIGFILSVLNSFLLNSKFVFKNKSKEQSNKIALIKTFISYGSTGLLLSNILLFVFIEKLGINYVIAPLVVMLITTPINFLLNKYWAFRERIKNEKN